MSQKPAVTATRSALTLVVVTLLAVLAIAATAQAGDKDVIESVTRNDVQKLLESEGFSVEVDEDGDLLWKLEGYNTWMFVAKDGESLQFYAPFGDGNATLKKVNTWNQTRRYSRSYLDDEGDPRLELDLDMAGGVTVARIKDFFLTCRVSFTAWTAEVVQ
ncbi:MAG: YbjN domain-containing protein [Candidatus Latescibacteria bacterium]|nr:YbjN domain-containing protein [Candidatus Latescibacterota bacterium]